MTLKDSKDQTISNAAPPLLTGRKWTSSDVVQHATSALIHNNIVGHVQLGRGGLALQQVSQLGIRPQLQRGGKWW